MKCDYCKRDMSPSAKSCPHCGDPDPSLEDRKREDERRWKRTPHPPLLSVEEIKKIKEEKKDRNKGKNFGIYFFLVLTVYCFIVGFTRNNNIPGEAGKALLDIFLGFVFLFCTLVQLIGAL